ncbi:MAG: cation:proton antiporter [Elusimicrobiota bacterium]|jgi:NhaP-type Na+/H+ or K+/H+ antiporter|nr:cation:proton antiporter [Elusimicrobiota bacterium]
MEGIIISLAIFIFLAHLFSVMFVKTRIPEVLPLMLLGIIIGPVLNIVNPSDFGMVDQVFTRILLIVILFESGLGIRISHIRNTWAQGTRLTLISFILTMALIMLLAKLVLGLNWAYSLILGCILADNSFAVIIPLLSKLNISKKIRTTLLVETTMNGVLSIVGAITMLHMAKMDAFAPSMVVAKILYSFLVSLIVGTAAAIFWTTVLNKVRKLENSIFLTLAFVLVVYSICETMGSDGAIGAFVFGIVAGNIKVIRKMSGFKFIERFTMHVKSKAFNEVEKSFFGEIVFVLRTFFFVYIGIAIQITSAYSMLCGLLFTIAIFIIRIPIANYSLDKQVNRLDTAVASAMVPKGLITAVLASLIAQSGIAGGQILQDIIYSAILFSIIFATIISFCIEKGYGEHAINFFFKRHIPLEEDTSQSPKPPPSPQSTQLNQTIILK